MDFAFFEYYLSAALLVTAMLGMGATLTPQEFAGVVRRPHGVAAVLLGQLLVTPLLAVAIAFLLELPQGVALGLLLIAALPGGLFSNLLTFLGNGNVALSITATAVSTFLCLVTTSVILRIFGGTHFAEGLEMPVGRVLYEIACFLLLPLLAGMLFRRRWPEHAPQFSKVFVRLSTAFLAAFVVGALSSGRLSVATYGWQTPVALFLLGAASLWVGVVASLLFNLSADDRFTVSIETLVRNGNLGLLLKASLFPAVAGSADPIGDGVLYVVLFYAGLSLVIGLYEVCMKRLKWGVLYSERASA